MTTANRAILVVEDELLLRLMAVDIVEDAGFEALAAATADEALAILEARADDVRLVFTDIQMPGRWTGCGWHTRFATAGPPSTDRDVRPLLIGANDLPDRGRFIAKPYDVHALSQVFQEMAGAEG